MAVTRKEEATKAYTPSEQVTTAQQQMQQTQQQKPAAYTPSEQVQQAQTALQQNQAQKPATYNSKYGAALDGILQQIQNPQQFKYEFNGDELFKYYADLYTQKGKQAANDVMGQAAALTGGYGNSYGQQVANQTYDQYLLNLYDKGMDLRDRAYQQYQDQLANQYNQYNTLAAADAADYDKYRDLVGDWQNERNYLTDRYDTERNYDYNQYRDVVGDWENERDYYTNLYNTQAQMDYDRYQDARNAAEQQYQFDAQLQENIRQFNESLNWDKMSSDQKYAAQYALSILQSGQMPSDALLQQAGLSKADADKLKAKISSGRGGSGGGQTLVVEGAMGNLYEINADGSMRRDKNGNLIEYDPATSKGSYLIWDKDSRTNTQLAATGESYINNYGADADQILALQEKLKKQAAKTKKE